jgi:hypothetical protein
LISKKQADYLIWKEILILQEKRENLRDFQKILFLKNKLNKGLNPVLKKLLKDEEKPKIKNFLKWQQPQTLEPHWISGFTAGDGSFFIKISKHPTCQQGYQVSANYNLVQHEKDFE